MDIWLIAVSMAATATAITDIFSIISSPHFLLRIIFLLLLILLLSVLLKEVYGFIVIQW
nr:MAG TPA: hypothetical protein [Caudoviricetes sp.]